MIFSLGSAAIKGLLNHDARTLCAFLGTSKVRSWLCPNWHATHWPSWTASELNLFESLLDRRQDVWHTTADPEACPPISVCSWATKLVRKREKLEVVCKQIQVAYHVWKPSHNIKSQNSHATNTFANSADANRTGLEIPGKPGENHENRHQEDEPRARQSISRSLGKKAIFPTQIKSVNVGQIFFLQTQN